MHCSIASHPIGVNPDRETVSQWYLAKSTHCINECSVLPLKLRVSSRRLGGSEIIDKLTLLEARKAVERQMERFNVCEKETKTKMFSKEGLALAQKQDPKEKARNEMREWINLTVATLTEQARPLLFSSPPLLDPFSGQLFCINFWAIGVAQLSSSKDYIVRLCDVYEAFMF